MSQQGNDSLSRDSDELESIPTGKRFKTSLSDTQGGYTASGVKSSLHGTVYQLKLLMLFLKRGLDIGHSFLLATEMNDAEKFDDVVFEYIDGQGQRKYRFLQAKHKQDESEKIRVNDLLTEKDNEFSLQKYFISYRKIKQNPRFLNRLLKDFVICTNINFEFDEQIQGKLKDASRVIGVEEITEEDKILELPDQKARRYRFTLNKQGSTVLGPIVDVLRDTSDSIRLARKLAECVSKDQSLDLRYDLFQSYHAPLCKEVIDIKNYQFYDKFIDSKDALSEEAKTFRGHFLEEMSKIKRTKDDKAIWRDIKEKKLKLSSNFGKVVKLNNNPQLSDPKTLAEKLADFLNQSEDNIVKVEKAEINSIKNDIDKLAGHVFIEKSGKTHFRSAFLKGTKLTGNLEIFRKELKEILSIKGINLNEELCQYQFNIKGFKTYGEAQFYSKPTLPNDTVNEAEIEEFLTKLVFAVDQPNEKKLGELLKQETGEEIETDSRRFITDSFQIEMLNWMKEKGGRFYSNVDGKKFFDEVKKMFTKRLPEHWEVPPKNPNFTGRGDLLKQIEDHFRKENIPVILTTTHGLGGIGKTNLAIEYVWRHYKQYEGVVWFNAENRNRLLADYISLGEDLNIIREDKKKVPVEERARLVKHWLEDPKRAGWLLIYDNAPKYGGDENEGVGNLFPTKGGKILVTSRYAKGWPQESIEVKVFEIDEAKDYIQKVLGDKALDIDQVGALAETLGYLPLALAQASAYIKYTTINISGYLELYKAKKKEFLTDETLFDQTLPPDSNRAMVYITWNITMEAIHKESLLAANWLNACACLASNDIPHFLLEEFANTPENNPKIPPEIFKKALGTLNSYSMLTINEQNQSASIHRLVQEVIRLKWRNEEKQNYIISVYHTLKGSFPHERIELEDFAKKRQLLPHLEAFLPHLDAWQQESLEVDPELRKRIEQNYLDCILFLADGYFWALGDGQKSREWWERALPILERHYGTDNPNVAQTLMNLGNAYGSLGDSQKQQELLERALKIKERHYGPDHPEVAVTLTNLGNAYGGLGDYQKKRELLERALEIKERHYGPDHPNVGQTLMNLGVAYGSLGDFQKQLELLERALKIKERHYGPDHPEVAITLTNLGNAYLILGDYQKQRELLERALPILERHYGTDNPNVAQTLMNLGIAYGSLGDSQKQRELQERALKIKERHYGPNHPEVAKTLMNLGNAYGSLGDSQKKLELLERALPILERYYGPNHPNVAITLTNLGNAYGSLGDSQKQRELLERTLPILERHYGPDHPNVGQTLMNLGVAYGSLGDSQKQRELLERALKIQERHYGPDHPEVAKASKSLGNAYGSLGNS
jgi:tetratricopeptide (TPR) repeat protein